jgi:hypothetical protein
MRKLIWLLSAVALGIAPSAAEAQFGRTYGPRLGPVRPNVPGVGDPFGRPGGIPGLPGQFDPFGRPRPPWLDFGPADPLGLPNLPGLPGQRFGPSWDVPGMPRQVNPFNVPRFSYPGVPGLGRPGSNNPWLDLDPATPRLGPPGRDIGPITPRPGAPNLGNPSSGQFVTPAVNPPQLDVGALLGRGSSGLKSPPPAESDSHSFDPRWWSWVLVGAGAVFVVSLIAGYRSGRRHA